MIMNQGADFNFFTNISIVYKYLIYQYKIKYTFFTNRLSYKTCFHGKDRKRILQKNC